MKRSALGIWIDEYGELRVEHFTTYKIANTILQDLPASPFEKVIITGEAMTINTVGPTKEEEPPIPKRSFH